MASQPHWMPEAKHHDTGGFLVMLGHRKGVVVHGSSGEDQTGSLLIDVWKSFSSFRGMNLLTLSLSLCHSRRSLVLSSPGLLAWSDVMLNQR